MDYLMGHNATGYSYFTGFGSRPAMNIHHRPSQADNIKEPVPGFVVGGPNVSMQDKRDVDYPDNPRPMQAYMDVWPSYASNEICLNWNSPTPYLFAFLEDKMGGMIEK